MCIVSIMLSIPKFHLVHVHSDLLQINHQDKRSRMNWQATYWLDSFGDVTLPHLDYMDPRVEIKFSWLAAGHLMCLFTFSGVTKSSAHEEIIDFDLDYVLLVQTVKRPHLSRIMMERGCLYQNITEDSYSLITTHVWSAFYFLTDQGKSSHSCWHTYCMWYHGYVA